MRTVLFFITFAVLGLVLYPNPVSAQFTCSSYALNFDGTDDAVEFDGITTGDSNTIEFWFYWDPSSTDTQALLSSLNDADYSGFRLYKETNQDGDFWFLRMESNEGFVAAIGWPDVGPQWYHIAIIFTPSETRYLINGEGGNDSNGWFLHNISLLESFPTTLHFGAGDSASNFEGMLDEFRIWSRALTGDEIRNNIYSHLAGGEDGLVTYFPFDEGAGSTTANATISSNDGTLQNGPTWGEVNFLFNNCISCTNPNISGQPVNVSVFVDDDASFSASSTDADSPTLQWQRSTNNGGDWSDISGETSGTLDVSNVTMSMNGYRYRAAFTNTCGTSFSDEAVLTVKVEVTDLGPVDICIGSSASARDGYHMDILVKLFKNGDLILEGSALNQRVIGNTRKYTVNLPNLASSVEFEADDILSCRVWVRRNGGSDEFPLQLWYNDAPSSGGIMAFSRIHKQAGYYYFRTDDDLSTTAGSSEEYEELTTTTSYQVIGEWSMPGSAMKRAAGNFTMSLPTNLIASLVPSGNTTMLNVTASNDDMLSVTIYDITGRQVRSFTPMSVEAGTNIELAIEHQGLSAGVYTVSIVNGGARSTLRFPVIQ